MAQRIDAIDAARGAAMLLVCLSHFVLQSVTKDGAGALRAITMRIAMVASPMFMLLSGIVYALISVDRPERSRTLRRLLADRAVFMLIIGHALIALAMSRHEGSLRLALLRSYMTDAIAVAIVAGPMLYAAISARVRLVVATALLAGTWITVLLWQPATPAAALVRNILVGPYPDLSRTFFPIIPWLAVYLVGTALGERLARNRQGMNCTDASRTVERTLLRVGFVAVAIVVAEKVGLRVAAGGPLPLEGWLVQLYDLTYPWRKIPPSPAYLLFNGGIALLVTAVLLRLDRAGRARWLLWSSATIGRASLFVFIVQFFIYYRLLPSLALSSPLLLPLVFVASVAVLVGAAHVWRRFDGNRLLTVGLSRALAGPRGGGKEGDAGHHPLHSTTPSSRRAAGV